MSSKVPLGGIVVSIHAPRAGRDSNDLWIDKYRKRFNPRTPQGGGDRLGFSAIYKRKSCNPRTPRGVRHLALSHITEDISFNPRTPRGVRLHGRRKVHALNGFNPRTPRGVRQFNAVLAAHRHAFQSTHPSRGATCAPYSRWMWNSVSIHAPLAGCDDSPCNGTGRTGVSIHAPLAGCDASAGNIPSAQRSFNPRTPRGVRQGRGHLRCQRDGVSIHAPLAGCDGKRSHKGNILPRIYGCYSPQIRFFSAVRPTPLLWHGSSTYILSCDFLFTSPSRS